jgi:hypothetical protein
MTVSQHRKHRGYETQRIARDALRSIWPYCEVIGAGTPGPDLTGTPGCAVEVKARRGLDLPGWLAQTTRNAGIGLPLLVIRPDGYGPASVDLWPVVTPLAWSRYILRAAGYGNPLTADDELPR